MEGIDFVARYDVDETEMRGGDSIVVSELDYDRK